MEGSPWYPPLSEVRVASAVTMQRLTTARAQAEMKRAVVLLLNILNNPFVLARASKIFYSFDYFY